jgi:Gpi18-like mannosyltransferase
MLPGFASTPKGTMFGKRLQAISVNPNISDNYGADTVCAFSFYTFTISSRFLIHSLIYCDSLYSSESQACNAHEYKIPNIELLGILYSLCSMRSKAPARFV